MILTPKELGRLAEHVQRVTDKWNNVPDQHNDSNEWELELRKEINADAELPNYNEVQAQAGDALDWLIEYYTATYPEL